MIDPEIRFRVEDLLASYVLLIDDDRLEEWPGLFTQDCFYRITTAADHAEGLPLGIIYADSRDMLSDRVTSLREANIYEAQRYRHVTGPVRIERAENGVAEVRSSFLVVRIMHNGDSILFASGTYLDRIDIAAAEARFIERIVVLDSQKIDTLIAIPL